MKSLFSIVSAVLLFLWACSSAFAQDLGSNPVDVEALPPSESERDSAEQELLLGPVGDPYILYVYGQEQFRPPGQTGAFIGKFGLGIEYTTHPGGSHIYNSFFFSGTGGADRWIPGAGMMFTAGVTVGYEQLFHATRPGHFGSREVVRVERDGTQFYGRLGPGISFRHFSRDGSGEFHPGVHTGVLIGGINRLSRHTSIFVEMSGTFDFFPTLDELRWSFGPRLTIGIRLLGQQGPLPMLRF